MTKKKTKTKKAPTKKASTKKAPAKKRTRKAPAKKQKNPASAVPEVFRYEVSRGETKHQINDIDAFCREHRLNHQLLWASRKRGEYRGWTIRELG